MGRFGFESFPHVLDFRPRWLAFLLLVVAVGGSERVLAEDVLFLTNGRQIVVDRYWEEGGQIFYQKNGSTLGFPRRLLERVAAGDADPERSAEPASGFRNEVASKSVEAARRSSLEGDIDEAVRQYRKAIESEPTFVETRLELGVLYLERGDLYAAESQLEQAKRISPDDARVRERLGDVYYALGRAPLAIREWQAALGSSPSSGLLYKLKKALRENDQDVDFEEVSHPHFLIRYDGSVNEAIGRILAAALDEEYYDMVRELRFTPRGPVSVTIYTNEEFRDQTHAPAWASGLNDGEIRIPVEGVSEMTPKLRRLLRHELTHSFVNAMTAGNCPSWLHEGLAQLFEGEARSDPYDRLREARAQGGLLPLWSLEGPLLDYDREKALLAYGEALAATEYLAARKGRSALLRILRLLGERNTMNDALKRVSGLDYQEFQTAWEADLSRYSTRGR
jgi:tetratricopeptide (TPR) repeat protein